MEQKKRIEHIDCLRGVTMFLVVLWHVYYYGFNTSCAFLDVLSAVRMPLFFFVSGLFVHLYMDSKSLYTRIRYVFLPTVASFLLYTWIVSFEEGVLFYDFVKESAAKDTKGGYWFTFAMIIMNILHFIISSVTKKNRNQKLAIVLISIITANGIIALKNWDWASNDAFFCGYFSLRLIAMYFPFYILGIVCKDNWDVFCRIIQKQWVISIALVSFLLLFFLPFGGFYKGEITSFCGVLFIYSIFNTYSDFFSTKTKVGTWLSYIGRHTLPIYLLHYFILRGIHLSWMGEQIALDSQWFLVFVLAFVITVLIVSACLIINSIVAVATPIHRLFLGK